MCFKKLLKPSTCLSSRAISNFSFDTSTPMIVYLGVLFVIIRKPFKFSFLLMRNHKVCSRKLSEIVKCVVRRPSLRDGFKNKPRAQVRKRIGTDGIDKIFQVSVRLHGKAALETTVNIDTTVQEKTSPIPRMVNWRSKSLIA